MTKTFNDKDIRDEIVNYVTRQFSHTYPSTKFMRALLKSQNLTIEEMIVPLSPEILQEEKTYIFGTELGEIVPKSIKKAKINPIPEQKDILRLEHIANHKHFLTENQEKEFETAYKSKTDNWVTEFSGSLNSIKLGKINRWEKRIQRFLDQTGENL